MEIKWLLDFLSLVDTRNFSRSADVRATTQPAFSRRIKALEEWIGATLFDRSTHPIEMTPAGQMFRPIAEEVLRRLLQSRDEIRQIGRHTEGMITFAATHSLSLGFFPSWINGIEKKTHVLRTRLDSNQVGNCVLSLLRGECHFMLSHTHPTVAMELPEDRFTSIVVGEDQLVPISSRDANGRPMHSLPGSTGKPVDYLAYVGSSAIGRAVDSMLEHCVTRPVLRRVFESHLAGVLKSMALEGRGLAWLPESEVAEELKAGTLLVSGEEKFFIPVQIRLFRSRTALSPAAENFWQALVDA
jgi:LysR family transcriptional regulator, hypochlorite-specific transcription factor HypT